MLLHYVTLRYVTLRYAILHYVTLRYVVTLCYVMLCYSTLRYIMLCYATLRYITLRYLTLCYIKLCYVALRNVTSLLVKSCCEISWGELLDFEIINKSFLHCLEKTQSISSSMWSQLMRKFLMKWHFTENRKHFTTWKRSLAVSWFITWLSPEVLGTVLVFQSSIFQSWVTPTSLTASFSATAGDIFSK